MINRVIFVSVSVRIFDFSVPVRKIEILAARAGLTITKDRVKPNILSLENPNVKLRLRVLLLLLPTRNTIGPNCYTAQHPGASSLFSLVSGGTSMAGFPMENPSGFKVNPVLSQGMTGKSVNKEHTQQNKV